MQEQAEKTKVGLYGILSILGLVLIVYIGVLTWNAIRAHDFIGRSDQQLYTITISGEGEVTAIPDIAEVSLGVETQNSNVAAAQTENTAKMNSLIVQLKGLDIVEEDIKTTNYSIYPRYDYPDGSQVLRGYIVSQNVTVKIRDLDKIADVLGLAGQAGVNQLGGLSFTIDEQEDLKQNAREKALANAKAKAETLADIAGVKLGRLVSFSESGNDYYPQPVYFGEQRAYGLGGGDSAPSVEPGSQDIIVYVTVTYEVL